MRRLLPTFLLISACATQPMRNPAMIGGTASRHPSVVFWGNCSGTMIAPNVLLTAGHCVYLFDVSGKQDYILSRSDEVVLRSFDGPIEKPRRFFSVHVAQVSAHPSWIKALRTYSRDPDAAAESRDVSDVGVVVFEESLPLVPAALPPVDLLRKIQPNAVGLQVFGAGCQARGDSFRENLGLMKSALFMDVRTDVFKVKTAPMDALTYKSAGICKGDSGGGGFLVQRKGPGTEVLTLTAVTSVIAGTRAEVEGEAPTGSYLARIDVPRVLNWLKPIVQKKAPEKVATPLPGLEVKVPDPGI